MRARNRHVGYTLALSVVLLLATAAPAAAKAPTRPTQPAECHVSDGGGSWTCITVEVQPATRATAQTVEPLSTGGTVFDKWSWKYNNIMSYGLGSVPGQGTIGSVRVVAALNLNGRRANSSWDVVVFTGPDIMARTRTRCLDDNSPTWLPDTVCADNWVYQTTYTRSMVHNYSSPYLSEDERYWFEYSFWIKPRGYSNPDRSDGYWGAPDQPLMSAAFSCSAARAGSQVCIFG